MNNMDDINLGCYSTPLTMTTGASPEPSWCDESFGPYAVKIPALIPVLFHFPSFLFTCVNYAACTPCFHIICFACAPYLSREGLGLHRANRYVAL